MTNPPKRLSRTPPTAVRDELCKEVGFRCPVDDCGLPYLTFHHFAPPWQTRQHHEPEGMIALCAHHAGKADGGYFPDEHLRRLKKEGTGRAHAVQGKFDYLRNDILAIFGGTAYYRTDVILAIDGEPCIFFNRDEAGYLLLNFKVPGRPKTRAQLVDNVWTVPPGAARIVCPPRGRSLKVEFENGDMFHIEYNDYADRDALQQAFPEFTWSALGDFVKFPVTVARFWERFASGQVEFTPTATNVGSTQLSGGIIVDCPVGVMIGYPVMDTPFDEATLRAMRDQLGQWREQRRPGVTYLW